jgi:hypothetical protein
MYPWQSEKSIHVQSFDDHENQFVDGTVEIYCDFVHFQKCTYFPQSNTLNECTNLGELENKICSPDGLFTFT